MDANHIHHIFHSVDYHKNKIYDTYCLDPVDLLHVVNKQYVTKETTYNTTLVNNYYTPFNIHDKIPYTYSTTTPSAVPFGMHGYMGDVRNLSFKTLFDRLLFPALPPTFVEPTFTKFDIDSFVNTPYGVGLPYLWDINIKATIHISLNHNERALQQAKLVFTKGTTKTEIVFTDIATTGIVTNYTKQIDINNKFDTVTLIFTYPGIATKKNNTHGVLTTTQQNTTAYTLTIDVTDIVKSRCEFAIAPYIRIVNVTSQSDINAPFTTANITTAYNNTYYTDIPTLYDNTVVDMYIPYDLTKTFVRIVVRKTNSPASIIAVLDSHMLVSAGAKQTLNGVDYYPYRLNIGSLNTTQMWHGATIPTIRIYVIPINLLT
jgi:hypothetical protein